MRTVSEEEEHAPRSFVFRQGTVSPLLQNLVDDLRRMMEPFTAIRLQESKRNRLKDFLSVAGPLGVTHFMAISQTDLGSTLRLLKTPRGPTCTFRIESYSLMRDIHAIQKHPHSPSTEYLNPPLVVLNGFAAHKTAASEIMSTVFQNMFPAINVQTLKLTSCRRVVMLALEEQEGDDGSKDLIVTMRHYLVKASPVGLTRSIKRVIKAKMPKLKRFDDISDYVLGDYDGQSSDSEAEDTNDNRLVLPQTFSGRGNKSSQKSAVRLEEIGPRVSLKLIKIEDGFADGEVLYHRYIRKTEEEAQALDSRKEEERRLKEQRKQEQEANVRRKKERTSKSKE